MSHHVFFLDSQNGRNDITFIVPPDTSKTIDENQRLAIIKILSSVKTMVSFLKEFLYVHHILQ